MNERLKQLAVQAKVEHCVSHVRLQEFTDAILKDVDKIIDDLYNSMPLENAAVLLTLDENIKQHFYGEE
jgi:hypothetical protein